MYEEFYGFKEKPFSMLPDPGFLYLSKKHQAALALLEYGVLNHVGFCVISGEAGAGKTTVLRALLERVSDDVTVGLITNTHQSFGGLLDWVLSAFDLHRPNLSQVEMHQIFMEYLIEEYGKNRSVLLIVDEAQNMNIDALEELRMLSNVNSEKDQLMQVVLSGQPALKETLRKPELMQFAQRIAVDYHLEPLSHEETCGYIQHRLVTAGAQTDVFTPAACERIHNYSGGTPRLINLLCETVLVYGYADQRELIDVDLVDEMVLERMKDSVVPIVNRDIAQQKTKTNEELEKDFPWIRPEGGTQGLKPEHDDHDSVNRGKPKPLKKNKSRKTDSRKQHAASEKVTEKAAVAAVEVAVEVAEEPESETTANETSGNEQAAEPVAKVAEPVKPTVIPAADAGGSRGKLAKYSIISAVIALLVIALYVVASGEKLETASVEKNVAEDALQINKQREQEAARVLELEKQAEILQKEREAALAKAEAEALARKQAEKLAEEKAALVLKAKEEKRKAEEKKRLAEAKERERRIKKREAEAKLESERIQREAAQLEKEKLEMQLRLEEELRLKQEQEARRLELEWQEKQRQAILDAEIKAKQEAAYAIEQKAIQEAINNKVKSKSVECTGPTARFKAGCR